MNINTQYKNLIRKIYEEGFEYEDPNRKGVIRKQITNYTLEHNFEKYGFPLIGLKQCYPKMAFNEMLCFFRGYTNLYDLEKMGVNFWRKDAYNYFQRKFGKEFRSYEDWFEMVNVFQSHAYGRLGKIYPHQITNWNSQGINQLVKVVERLKKNPMSTKNIITMWNPSDLDDCALSPCHTMFTLIVRPLSRCEREELIKGRQNYYYNNIKESQKDEYFDSINIPRYGLTVEWNQASVDTFLGLPMNIAYYAFTCYILAKYLNMKPIGVVGNLSNVHLYSNSFEAVEVLLGRDETALYNVTCEVDYDASGKSLEEFLLDLTFKEHIFLEGYSHLGRLDVEMLAYS